MASLREVPSDLSSRSSSGVEDVVRIRLNFGGYWKSVQGGHEWQYVDGETYLEKLSLGVKYADLMHMVNEKINGSAIFKYTPPTEMPSPHNLVTVVDDEHVQEMIDEYVAAAANASSGKRLRLYVWLSRASEEEVYSNDAYLQSSTLEAEESDLSDGTHSPMQQYSHWIAQDEDNLPNDVDMQMMVAEDACLYMNAMEEAVMTESSNWPLDTLTSGDSNLMENKMGNAVVTLGMDKSFDFEADNSSSPHLKESCANPSTPNPETPPISQRSSFRLPSSLGSSLGQGHKQTHTVLKPSYRLPSRLGSDLGNSKSILKIGQTVRPPRASYKVIRPPNATIKPPVAPDMPIGEQEDQPKGRTTPNGTPIPAGTDHFHTVRASELKPVAKLGEGSFGEVLQCTNRLFGDIAVKCAKAEGDQELFSQELRMLSSLNHPNVLRFFGVVTDETQGSKIVGVMTEFMQGRSLSYYLGPEYPRWSLLIRAKLARGAVNGLMYLHQHDIIHFDLKPENLLLDYPLGRSNITPGIKVADFGLSKYKVDNYASYDSGLRGTLPYMAPEIVDDGARVTEKADIWSLGMVLWEMYTHSVPFGNMTAPEITFRLKSGNAFPHISPEMEPEWAALVEACCRSAPDDRFSLENIAAMLDQMIQAESSRNSLLY